MDAERLAAIRAEAAEDGVLFDELYVRELLDHIDALQAENERLRDTIAALDDAVDPENAKDGEPLPGTYTELAPLRRELQRLQARVTLLEGLLENARRVLRKIHFHTVTVGSDYGMPRIAADAIEMVDCIDAELAPK